MKNLLWMILEMLVLMQKMSSKNQQSFQSILLLKLSFWLKVQYLSFQWERALKIKNSFR